MKADGFRLLPEGTAVGEILDDVEFTEVTGNGEIYTLYRVVRVTHEATDSSPRWTHMANVVRVRRPAIGVALLRVARRQIDDSRVTLAPNQD